MTLEEFKYKVYALIEEYSDSAEEMTEDEDLATKMNTVINQVQNEMARFKKINGYAVFDVEKDEVKTLKEIDESLYQLNLIRGVEAEIIGDRVIFNEDGTAKIFYYKYPTQINQDTDDSFEFELDTDVLEVMVYGVAADLLKSDVSSNYGKIYADRYREMKQELDPRKSMGMVYIDGGMEV
jgi:uncharacterized protein YwqG